MAKNEEQTLTHAGAHEMGEHVQGYESFIKLFKYGAVVCLVIGLVWMLIVKAYW